VTAKSIPSVLNTLMPTLGPPNWGRAQTRIKDGFTWRSVPEQHHAHPSSRIFFPVEIWYYSIVPGVISTEVHLMFYLKNNVGLMKLYSPTTDTFRALLIPRLRRAPSLARTTISPRLRSEQYSGLSGGRRDRVRRGQRRHRYKYMGNDELLGKVSSPTFMLRQPMKEQVKSRFIVTHPKLDTVQALRPTAGPKWIWVWMSRRRTSSTWRFSRAIWPCTRISSI